MSLTSNIFKKTLKFFKTKEFWFILIITAIGAFLRFYKLRELMVFLGDEGRDVLAVKRLIIDHDPILVGPTTSVGKIYLPPLYYYFMAPWLALFKLDPVGPAVGVAFLGTLTIPLFYFFAKKLLGKSTAIFGTILYSTASVVIANTRSSWNPNPMPFVSLLLIYNLYSLWQKKSWKAIIGVWIFLGLALQLHYMVILLIPFLAIFIGLSFWQSRSKSAHLKNLLLGNLVGFILFLVLLSPLFLFDMRHDWINFYGLKEFFVKGHHTNASFFKIIKDLEGRSHQVIGDILGFPKGLIRNLFTQIVVVGFLILAWTGKRKKKELIFLAVWFVLGVLGLAIYEGDVYPHYVGFMFALPFLIVGYELSYLWKKLTGKVLTMLILIILLGNNLYRSPAWVNLGWNVDSVKHIAEVVSKECPQEKYNIVLLDATKDYRAMNYRYFLEILGCPPLDITEYPQAKVLYVISGEQLIDFEPLNLWEVKSVGELELVKDWKFEGGPYMYKLTKK